MNQELIGFFIVLGVITLLIGSMLISGKVYLYWIKYADRSIDSKVFWDRFFAFVIIYAVIIIIALFVLLF